MFMELATKYKTGTIFFVFLLFFAGTVRAQQFYLLVGTYTNTGTNAGHMQLDSTGSKGIYLYRFNAATGQTEFLQHTEGVCNPSFLTVAPDGHHVYACTESRMLHAGTVSAFDLTGGRLTFINKVSSFGDNPAYVSVDPSGRWAAVANYTGGSYAICGIGKDGALLPPVQHRAFEGHGVNPARQEKSHVHSAVFSPEGRHLYIQDLGLDRITMYPCGPGGLDTAGAMRFAAVPGAGPRHLTFGPDGRFAYLIEEMGGMVDVFRYDPATGRLDPVQRIAAHPDTARGPFRSADIHLSADGNFLYTTNRAESQIAIFSVDRANGTLRLAGYQSVFGKEPRNFALDPTGNWLLVANQESNIIVVFQIDRKTGLLKPLNRRIKVPAPTSLRFAALK